jgi:glycerol-3-phosphate acyltransferase PlsX
MKIAIDAMGGDHAPRDIVEGTLLAAKEWPDVELILVGDSAQIKPLIGEIPSNIRIYHTDEVITSDDEPVKAVRRKKDASMVVTGRMVKEGEADAMISAGNTGALMIVGLLGIGRIKGIERPALTTMIPTMDGNGILALDLGANMDASAENLLQYAIMGSLYRNKVDGLAKPRVGLLNVGTEEGKGNELAKETFALLEKAPIHFVGNVEARDLLEGSCDVLVCEGFVGNILLKTLEGAAGTFFSVLRTEFTRSWTTKLAALIMKPGLTKFKNQFDYKEIGGAALLGVEGLCMKCHGSSEARTIKGAIGQARNAIKNNLVQSISTEISSGK